VGEIERVRTERLLLRRFTDADRSAMAAINADPAVMEHFPAPLDRAASDAFLDRIEAVWQERGWGPWAVEVVDPDGPGPQHPEPQGLVGEVGLLPADHVQPGAVEVGWRVARAVWGRGYAPEAARAALRVGFDDLGLAEIISFTVPQNTSSRRVMEKIGMRRRPEADFEHPLVDPVTVPHLVRHVMYVITAEEWAGTTGPR
jgi:RimJ/RimL family protein N-acetyltransferase